MPEASTPTRNVVLICSCSGVCPSMSKIDFWALTERVRLELGEKVEFVALHPRLCEEDGERMMGQLLDDSLHVVTSACAEKRQEKLLREGFQKAGVPMDRAHWLPISMAQEDTDAAFRKIADALGASPAQPHRS